MSAPLDCGLPPDELSPAELESVAATMIEQGVEVTGPLTCSLIAGGRSNLTFRLTDGPHDRVLRLPPRRGRTPTAHDVAREYRVTKALSGTEVPVAPAVTLCEDETLIGGPFAVAEHVAGRTIQRRSELESLGAGVATTLAGRLVATLAALHRVDYAALGLERFGRPDGYAARQLRRWSGQWELVQMAGLDRIAGSVAGRLAATVPRQSGTSIVHGDFRIDNTILGLDGGDGPRINAVVDWELSTLGDPIADVAMMCAYRDRAFDLILGEPSAWTSDLLPSADELAGQYEAAGGVRLDHWDFHLALAYFKIAVIAAGIEHRRRSGSGSGAGFDTAGDSVATYLELATTALEQA